jgi:hypothetical protein
MMEIESIQNYVGDEDCFSVGRHWIPNQYFKCPDSGVEMNFVFRIGSGWSVGAPAGQSCLPVLHYFRNTGKKIPFPPSPKKYAGQEQDFYATIKKLREME